MATPIIELIAQDILASINAITIDNGFNQDLVGARMTRRGITDGSDTIVQEDGVVVISQLDPEEDEALSADGNPPRMGWAQPFRLSAIVLHNDAAVDAIDTKVSQVRSDIEKKLLEDESRGGNAIDTVLGSPAYFNDEQAPEYTGIEFIVIVRYRTKYGDPYTLG